MLTQPHMIVAFAALTAGACTEPSDPDAQGTNEIASAVSGTTFRNARTGLCLDSDTSGRAYTLACNGGSFQKWTMIFHDGFVTLRNVATLLCLDSNTSGKAYTLGCNGGNFQNWEFIDEANGANSFVFRDVSTQFCLDTNGSGPGHLYTLGCNHGDFQLWQE